MTFIKRSLRRNLQCFTMVAMVTHDLVSAECSLRVFLDAIYQQSLPSLDFSSLVCQCHPFAVTRYDLRLTCTDLAL